ncbi:hypothetical protein [Entomobacter blattae]|uniref:Uncharacterized protein n=1 Tax=Entomobacter blattae TaxID=2762277 RepID=A0A7H1NP68_9PROT|nr:hypothetical protein [Entomobacter blattae]QNT77578.1 hypothetical protein JGUZn3_03210 [Entomobacter blattae]
MTGEKPLQNQISLIGVIERHFEEIRTLYTQKVKKEAIWGHFKNLYDLNTQSAFWQTYYKICRENGLKPRKSRNPVFERDAPEPTSPPASRNSDVFSKTTTPSPSPSEKPLNPNDIRKIGQQVRNRDLSEYKKF